jgi:ketosteroid isomerase-like protein
VSTGTDEATGALDAVLRFDAAFGAKDVDAVVAAMTPDCVFEDTSPPHVPGVDLFTVREGLVAEKLSYVEG